ncbi:TonB-dependent receptor [Phocaeicola salanitronis]|uniref:SusC/RagA family TonB-linked outer membrane protein n=1 Tax=Phocaeicola salanitronis TaxID=376805 RepID=UPI0023F9376F|nr:TonB-dependent receptor [Phocaeicola salanitronis]
MRTVQKTFGLWLILLISCPLSVLAQTRTITGIVRDASDVVIGASVVVNGDSKVGTITDMDGAYSISVPASAKELVFSFIGYETKIVSIDGKSKIDVTLEESSQMLEEVVAIGYAKVQRKDLTGATSSVGAKDLVAVPATTAAQALQGKAAGVNIVTSSGAPGASMDITIRGGTSITQSTKPLYIVDGFEMDDALNNIDVNDIESIDILKDASSTAIYGARGSNGIVLITTKSGKKGKTQVSYNTYFSFDKLSKKMDMMDDAQAYARYQYEMAVLQGKESGYSAIFDNNLGTDAADFYTGAYSRIAERYTGMPTIDWQDEVFGGTALTQSHNVNISTGTEKTQVMLSYNYNGQDGLLANHGAKKSSFRAKINSELYKGVRLDVNAMFNHQSVDGGGAYSGMKSVLLQPIMGGTMFSQEDLLTTQTYLDYSSLDSSFDTANPLVQNEASTSNKRNKIFSVNAGLEFDFLKYFTWRTAGSYTWTHTKATSFADENSTAYLTDQNTGMNGSIENKESYKWQITNTLNYNQTFNKIHKLNVLLGQETTYSESEGNKFEMVKFPYPNIFGLDKIDNATMKSQSASHSRNGIVSVFARANYNYDERYLITATVRGDGSSRFAKGNKWGFFPSASGAWRISEEDFWKESKINNVVNSAKLRIGYGTTGNCNISDYMYVTSFKESDYPINSTTQPVYVIDETLGNKDLKWETMHSTNVGIDLSLFNSRLNLSVDWYNNKISNLLLKSVIPASTGYKNQFQNIGEMRNRGWEFTLNTVNVRTKDFTWTSDLNMSFNQSKVISLEDGIEEKVFNAGSNRGGTLTYYASIGERLGDMYGYKYEGIYTTNDFIQNADGTYTLKEGIVYPTDSKGKQKSVKPGDIKFGANDVDENGNPIFKQGLLQKIGNGTPVCIGGFNNTFTYKGFDLSVFMKFSIGNDIYNATKHSMSPYAMFQNVPKEFGENYYRLIDPSTGKEAASLEIIKQLNPNESANTWSLSKTNSDYITYPSSYYVEDGSYLRIAQLTVGYTFPKSWTQKVFIQNARIYFTANNLATITGYSGYDPEVKSGDEDAVVCTPGYDSSTYPRSRSYVIGINLTF